MCDALGIKRCSSGIRVRVSRSDGRTVSQQQMRSAVLWRGERIQKAHFEPSSEPRDRPYANGVEPKLRYDIRPAYLNVFRPRGPGVVAAGEVRIVIPANHQYGKVQVLQL